MKKKRIKHTESLHLASLLERLYVNLDKWQKGYWGWDGRCVFRVSTLIPQEKLPAAPHPAHPTQHLAGWQRFNEFLEYLLGFPWPNMQKKKKKSAGLSAVIAVTMEIRKMTLKLFWFFFHSYIFSFTLKSNKEFVTEHHSIGYAYIIVRCFSSELNIHQKASKVCITMSKKKSFDPRPILTLWSGFGAPIQSECIVLMIKRAVKP